MFKQITILALLVLASVLGFTSKAFAQKDKLEGLWYNEEKDGKIEIYKAKNGKFYGKIVWLKTPLNEEGKPKVDKNNPDDKNKTKPLIGLLILKGFNPSGDKTYEDGTIYDPKNGKTYSCKITYNGNTLDIRGFIGVTLIGRTTVWTKAD